MRPLRWSITAAAIGAIIVKDADVTMIAAGATMMMVIIGADIERNRCGAGVQNPAPLGPLTRV